MAKHVRIYKPAKTAMQSGRAKTREWRMEFVPQARSTPDPIIGWNGSADTQKQVKLDFDTMEAAVDHARRKGYTYTIRPPKERRIRPKAYADNFAFKRLEPWTH